MPATLIDTGFRLDSSSVLFCSESSQPHAFLVSSNSAELDRDLYCPRCEMAHGELVDLAEAEIRGVLASEDSAVLMLDVRELVASAMRAAV